MQVKTEQLIRQQEIMKALGFYHGKIEGIWGPKSIDAKKKFEASPTFSPGIPKNGMPFADHGPYPANIMLDHATGLLDHPQALAAREAAKAQAQPEVKAEAAPVAEKPAAPAQPAPTKK